ncbi:hypothetical protein VNO77_15664 [Canavalia gladiata]|uniref:VQ domain-containing protein n=1 Tax=Canavalia gladiata TaxID=3824 RepID=A0AAN9QVY6_CANGL
MKLRKHTHTCIANSHKTPNSLAMHKDSHTVCKTKPPKIRIIHIFAPEIIKTDAENFRELVQKLTGKPSGENKNKKKVRVMAKKEQEHSRSSSSSGSGMSEDHRVVTKKIEVRNNNNGGFWGFDVARDRVKEELEVGVCCSNGSSGGGYLGGFSDLEGFISEISEFPLIPLDATHIMQGFQQP